MCGIAGFVNAGLSDEQADQLIRRMTDIVRHRGPDDDGHLVGDGIALGMRRLAIIDLASGQQPITNEDGSVVVVFNGEIYNYRELRAELERTGHHFATHSDTETLVHAYEEDGPHFVRRLRGMFAFALWDRRRQRLLLVRDRFGKKPLYYSFDGERLVFGSELKSLLLAPGMRRELDPAAVEQYFTYGYVPSPATILQGIAKLPAGHILTLENGRLRVERYWQLDFTPRCQDDVETAAQNVRSLLAEAVRLRLISEVPLGAFLSGGIDSSIVVALMSQLGNEPVKTFSIGFEEQDHSELHYARLIAERYATDHHEFIVRPDVVADLPRLVWDFDEPFADASMVPTYYVSRLAREHVTVALSGDGGDELFGGYWRYKGALDDVRLARRLGPARQLAALAGAMLPEGVRGQKRLRALGSNPEERYVEHASIFATPSRQRLLMPAYQVHGGGDPRGAQLRHFKDATALDFLPCMQHVDVEVYLPDDILTKVDRASMFSSLETRAPLLDHILAEYVASLPHTVRNPGGQLKYLLKKAAEDLLPAQILTRPKMGFGLPVDHWLRGPLRDFSRDVLLSQRARTRGVVRTGKVEQLMATHQNQFRNVGARIWALLCFELWCRAYLDGTDAAATAQEHLAEPARRA